MAGADDESSDASKHPDRMDALEYHERTKHSAVSVRRSRHVLDWENQPLPFKIYSSLSPMPLPREFARPEGASGPVPDLQSLARLLHYTAGIVRTKVYAGGHEHYFRAAACTGALYHIDLYVVCGDLEGLEAGVYHFGPHDFSLRGLRGGDHRRIVVDASDEEPAVARAPVVLVSTSTFWRNAWKYESRTYRHCFWDNGTMLANLLEVAAAWETPARIVLGFADGAVNELLGLDTRREVALSCVALGRGEDTAAAAPALLPLAYETVPLSRHEIDYPLIRAAHAGSSFDTPGEARQWRQQIFERPGPAPSGSLVPLVARANTRFAPTASAGLHAEADTTSAGAAIAVEQVIARRGSARQFALEPISYEALSHILRAGIVDMASDLSPGAPDASPARLYDLYLIVNAVDGLAPGAYVYRPAEDALELLRAGDFRREAGYLDLGQDLAADASVNFYALSDLGLIAQRLGNRGYRAAALEAAVSGGRIYLAAYGLGLGATGLTFFDDDVTTFFSPHAAGKGVLFLTAVGRPRRG